jgi:hypothetical protein
VEIIFGIQNSPNANIIRSLIAYFKRYPLSWAKKQIHISPTTSGGPLYAMIEIYKKY